MIALHGNFYIEELNMKQYLCVLFLLLTCCATSAQNEGQRIRNIVLVHGAWADGSGWKGPAPI